jgi:TP901 family phage tail tape measure protein
VSDFTISGGLDPRGLLEGLKQFEQQAAATGARAGESLGRGVASRASSLIPSSLSKALQNAESGAASSGAALGRSLAAGVSAQVGRAIPSSLQKALTGANSSAGSSGKQLGTALASGVASSVSSTIPAALNRALGSGSSAASQSGKQFGTALAQGAGGSLQSQLPPAFLKAVGAASSSSRQAGVNLGSGLGSGIGSSLDGVLPAQFKRVFAAGQGAASGSGVQIGQALGQGIGRGVDQNKALFAAVVNQAQKAAREVGLVFNTVKLRFETPKGEIVPQKELDKLRQLNPALDGAARSLATFTGQTTQGQAGLERLSSGFTNASRQGGVMQAAMAGISFSLANTLTNAMGSALGRIRSLIGEFTALDTEIRKAATAAEEPGAYERLEAVIEKVGIEAAGTQKQVAELATSLVRAGYKVGEVEVALAGVVRGAEATGTSFDNMGSIVGNTLRGFGLQVDQTSRVVDVLVKTANASNASVEGLGYTFQYAAPVANTLKVSLEDLAATAGLMANAGIDASVAGTGLRTGLQRLQKAAAGASGESLGLSKGQEKLTNAMKMLGAEVTTTQGTLKPLDQVFLSLKDSMGQMEVAAQVELASAIFGDEAGSKFLAVINQSEQAISGMYETIRNAKGSTDVARGGMQGFQMALMQLEGALGVITSSFGKVLSAGLAPFLNLANLVLGTVAAMPGPIRALAATLVTLTGAYVAAKVAAVAFGRAVQQPMVAGAIKELQVLSRFLRMEFKRDLAGAAVAWQKLSAGFNANSANAAVAGLAKIVQGLKSLNAAQAVAGFQQLGQAIAGGAKTGGLALQALVQNGITGLRGGLANAATGASLLGNSLRTMAANSAMAQTGLKGTAAVLQGSMTAGATGAANAMTGLSRVLAGAAGLSGGQVAAGFASAAAALGPLAIAAAAVVPAVLGYNQIMGQSRQVTASVGPVVEQLGRDLKGTGVSFQDFGRQGGPVAEITRNLGKSFEGLVEKVREIPGVGKLAAMALQGMWTALKNSPIGAVLQGLQWLIDKTREAYQVAGENQAIIEAGDQFEQFDEQIGKAAQKAAAFREKLATIDGTVPAEQVGQLTGELDQNRRALGFSITASENLAAKFTDLAVAARANNQPELAANYETLAKAAKSQVQISTVQLQQLDAEAVKRGLVAEKLQQQGESASSLTQKLMALNAEASKTGGDQQLMTMALSYGKAMADLEQSRFSIAKARGQYELQRAQEAGASEGELNKIRQANRQLEAQALQAKANALAQQQVIEARLLEISQRKAQIDANLSVIQAKNELLDAQAKLAEATAKNDAAGVAAAAQQVQLKQQAVGLSQENVGLLGQIQPLERAIAQATNETAVNSLKAEAAGQGFYGAVARSTQATASLGQGMAAVEVVAKRAADGSIVLSQQTTQAATATQAAAGAANQLQVNFQAATTGASNTASASSAVDQALRSTAGYAQQTSTGLGQAATQASATSTNTAGIQKNLGAAQGAVGAVTKELGGAATQAGEAATQTGNIGKNANPASLKPINQALGQAAGDARVVATAQMAENLSRASGSAGGLRSAMQAAATAAQTFYNTLAKASGLPGSRWTGGPVDAGQTVRINDGPAARSLGQESFLSSTGQLSLINRPPNSLWTAPTSGLVIPAGVTEGLKERGAFAPDGQARGAVSGQRLVARSRSGSRDHAAVIAHQAVAIGKLQQSVDRLVEKDWAVHVKVRNDGGASHLNLLNRMR